ncbi:hypothetical protein [Gracilimonas sediminicola]|uniref:hypothetical protein n=1 Tax=Gracilimonas sediminicola TaxID=2952158 RepID=UPI0038D43386
MIAKYIVILFGIFLIGVGLLMLLKPEKAREYLKKAGSTNLINYSEITIRMIPAAGLIIYSEFSKFPEIFKYFGWFMIGTSVVLYFVPRRLHHRYALMCANFLNPQLIRMTSPISMIFGIAIIYSVL